MIVIDLFISGNTYCQEKNDCIWIIFIESR